MADCLFCRIAKKEISGRIIHEDDQSLAFEDIHPQAPVHFLVIPKRHIASLSHVMKSDRDLLGTLLLTVNELVQARGLAGAGYRIVINSGSQGGQTVDHLHIHVLAGRQMTWPPG